MCCCYVSVVLGYNDNCDALLYAVVMSMWCWAIAITVMMSYVPVK